MHDMPTPVPVPGRATQAEISAEIADIAAHRSISADPNWGGHRTLVDYPPYRSSVLRHPSRDLELVDPETIEFASPAFGHRDVHWTEHDLTKQVNGEPLGERIVVTGRVVDGEGRPVRGQLLEIWQANAAGRQRQKKERNPAPLDPNFNGKVLGRAAHALRQRGGGVAVVAICIGVGQGLAVVLER